jgi:transposase
MDALNAHHDAAVQMIDTSIVRVHQHGACIADNNHHDIGRSRGGLTSKIYAVADTSGLAVHLALTPGEAHDKRLCSVLLSALPPQTILLADRRYDANWIRELARQQGAWANNVGVSRPDMTNSQPTIWRSSNSHQSEFGYAPMSPRLSSLFDVS